MNTPPDLPNWLTALEARLGLSEMLAEMLLAKVARERRELQRILRELPRAETRQRSEPQR
jgi:hypothetical protein